MDNQHDQIFKRSLTESEKVVSKRNSNEHRKWRGKKSREKNCRGAIHEVKFLSNRSSKHKEQKNYRKKIIKEITFKNPPELP